jgi:hypothetical protein
MRTKKCKIITVPADRSRYYVSKEKMYDTVVTQHIPDGHVVPFHIELLDKENDDVIAWTDACEEWMKIYPIPQSFIDKFIQSSGQIKEVLVELQECGALEQGNCIFGDICENCSEEWTERIKLDSNGYIIIHPVKTEIKIEDIPVEAIKMLIKDSVYNNRQTEGLDIVEQWLETIIQL